MEKLIKLNLIIEDYINYLYRSNPIFLNHAQFFSSLNCYDEKFALPTGKYKPKKMNATETFLLVKEFFEKHYSEEMKELETLFNTGVFNIYYIDELYEEKLYTTREDEAFCQQNTGNQYNLNLPLRGNLNDFRSVVHECRHQLNVPKNGRGPSNDTLTEALSMFDELLAFDMLEDKIGKEDVNISKLNYFSSIILKFDYVNFISNLVIIKNELGAISEENYEILFGNNGKKEFIEQCIKFEEEIESYKDIQADTLNWYTFGVFLIFTMYKNYRENNAYMEKIKELNKKIKNNVYIVDALKGVDIDLTDDNIINELRNNLIDELRLLKQKNKMIQIKKLRSFVL